jgi:hypothetical protein
MFPFEQLSHLFMLPYRPGYTEKHTDILGHIFAFVPLEMSPVKELIGFRASEALLRRNLRATVLLVAGALTSCTSFEQSLGGLLAFQVS